MSEHTPTKSQARQDSGDKSRRNLQRGNGKGQHGFHAAYGRAECSDLEQKLEAFPGILPMPSPHGAKYILKSAAEGWITLFLRENQVTILADSEHSLERAKAVLNGICGMEIAFEPAGSQFALIDLAEEMMTDKFIEKWLNHPDPALNNLTPWQASKIRSFRKRLIRLIEEWERKRGTVESDYEYPFAWLKSRLGLTGGEDIALEAEDVASFREAAVIKDGIGDYSWLSEEYAQVVYMTNLVMNEDQAWRDRRHRSVILYFWYEYTTLTQPEIDEPRLWTGALTAFARAFPAEPGSGDVETTAARFDIPVEDIEAVVDRLRVYLERYPLKAGDLTYALDLDWDALDGIDQMSLYEELIEAMLDMVELDAGKSYEESLEQFLQDNYTASSDELANQLGEFFTHWYLLDARGDAGDLTVAEMFAESMDDLGAAEREALKYLQESHLSIYRVLEAEGTDCRAVGILTGQEHMVVPVKKHPVCRDDYFLARLLPMEGAMVPMGGWLPVASVMENRMVKIAERFAAECTEEGETMTDVLKSHGIVLLTAFSHLLKEQEEARYRLM